jgi:hypothetical protein
MESGSNWIFVGPGRARILEALRQIEEEAPGLIDEATLAATEPAKGRGNGGHVPQ